MGLIMSMLHVIEILCMSYYFFQEVSILHYYLKTYKLNRNSSMKVRHTSFNLLVSGTQLLGEVMDLRITSFFE